MTLKSRLDEIRVAAARFREAIERCDPKALTICIDRFPVGSCGDTTPLLGTYLANNRLGTFMYALGERVSAAAGTNRRHSHAWLVDGDLIVDITADQFLEIDQKVIVTTRSEWHETFERESVKDRADYRIYDERTVSALGRAYAAILTEMTRDPQVVERTLGA